MPDPQPVVLVGGRARRFGRDKLREPFRGSLGGAWLVDQPIRALESAFGPCIWLVGDADPQVAVRGARHIPDRWPGAGPLGGILTALEAAQRGVFVLAGDLPGIMADDIRLINAVAAPLTDVDAVLAFSDGPEPCIGIYRVSAIPVLERQLHSGQRSLLSAISHLRTVEVPLPPGSVANANRADDLPPMAPPPPSGAAPDART